MKTHIWSTKGIHECLFLDPWLDVKRQVIFGGLLIEILGQCTLHVYIIMKIQNNVMSIGQVQDKDMTSELSQIDVHIPGIQ